MRRASKVLKGGVIVGLSTATFIAYGGTALAATVPAATGITITPAAGTTANTGDCLVYTATATAATTPTGTLDVQLKQPSGATTVSFCTSGAATTTGTDVPAGDAAGQLTHSFTLTSGSVSFGVMDTAAEADAITVFDDQNANGLPDNSTEAHQSSTATFVGNTGNSSVKHLAATPSNVLVRPGDSATFTVTATNGNTAATNQGVSGATVKFKVTGPDATTTDQTCTGTTHADGTITCVVPTVVSNTAAGTDTVTFYVENGTGPGLDSGDTQTTATMTNDGPAPAKDTVVAFCNASAPSATARACTDSIDASNPATNNSKTEHFGFDVLDPVAHSAGSNDPGSAVTVDFTMSGGSSAATLSATSAPCNTGATPNLLNSQSGCSVAVSVTEPNPTVGEKITVTGTLHGGTAAQSDSASVTFVAATSSARNITLTPPSQNVIAGHTGVLIATVTDSKGNPVPGVNVDFTSTGQGAFVTGCVLSATCTTEQSGSVGPFGGLPATNAAGQIEVQVSSNTTGGEFIGATIDPTQTTQCADQAGFVNGAPVSGVAAGNCSAGAVVKYITAPRVTKISERPHLSGHKSGHTVRLTAVTHPNLRHRSVHFYIVRNGINHLVASHGTGSTGVAHVTVRHLKKGHYTFVCRVVKLGSHYVSHFSNRIHKHIT